MVIRTQSITHLLDGRGACEDRSPPRLTTGCWDGRLGSGCKLDDCDERFRFREVSVVAGTSGGSEWGRYRTGGTSVISGVTCLEFVTEVGSSWSS